MKVAVIGGASSYTPELVDGLLEMTDRVPVSAITLMDPNAERLQLVAGFAERMAARRGTSIDITYTDNLDEAVEGASYVVTQIRVGGNAARIADEKLGARHGIIGQETTGVGGFACALRTIPVVLEVARAMEKHCPDAYLLNFTNPAGIITEAVLKHSAIRTVGLCNIPIGIQHEVAKRCDCEVDDVELDYLGLNHLAWVRGVRVRGEDVTERMFTALNDDAAEEWGEGAVCEAMQAAMRSLRMYCNPYLQYFYATGEAMERQSAKATTRGEDVMDIERRLFEKYADPTVTEKPAELGERGGAHYSTAACRLLDAIENDRGARQIVCCRNDGAIPILDDDVSVEVTARLGREGATPEPIAPPEDSIAGLLHSVKAYESLTVKAAVTGDRDAALLAMMQNPLMPGVSGSADLLDELVSINEPYLDSAFFKETIGVAHGN